jgi:hypothetical protein
MVNSGSSEFLLRRPEQPSYHAAENKQEALRAHGKSEEWLVKA